MALTALKIRQAKPKEKPYKLFDERGLFLLVNPTGSKLWRFRYKYAGKEKQISFGHYPDISLADAQASRGQALTLEPDSLYGAGHRVHPVLRAFNPRQYRGSTVEGGCRHRTGRRSPGGVAELCGWCLAAIE
jgi:hypothetical protein